jgi:tetratricopeptide (TPR) repeat protein
MIKSIAAALLLSCCTWLTANAQPPELLIKNMIGLANQESNDTAYLKIIKSADSLAQAIANPTIQARVNQAAAGHFYATDADKSIEYQQKAHQLYLTAGNKSEATVCLQNIAFTYEEQKKNYDEALQYAQKAIAVRIELKDTMEQANMYKYIAFLHGKMHNFEAAKQNGAMAVTLYTTQHYLPGLAVTYRNLALVYEEEKKYDSSVRLLQQAITIWQGNPENEHISGTRLYGCRNELIRIYTSMGKMKLAESEIQENMAVDASRFHYIQQLGFLKEARDFYTKKKDKSNAKFYTDRYATMANSLRAEGKHID